MPNVLYENEYKQEGHFRFGENWRNFLSLYSPQRLRIAKASLIDFLGSQAKIKGKSFLDLGCGSGLFSLAAYKLGADRIVSVDVDQGSVACVESLRNKEGRPKNWRVELGSALDKAFLKTLGPFDIVYSWGVLHHTGSMDQAIDNATKLVKSAGYFYLAIYNHNSANLHGSSAFWLKVKKMYNKQSAAVKRLMEVIYGSYLFLGILGHGRNPWRYIATYDNARGMSWRHDIRDWLGGYPYEYAHPEDIVTFLGQRGFACLKILRRNGIGCNEFLFQRLQP